MFLECILSSQTSFKTFGYVPDGTFDENVHIIYAGQSNLDWIDWESNVLQRIVDTGLKSATMTFIYMYRVGL